MSRKKNREINRRARRLKSELRYYESVLRDARSSLLDYEKEWQQDFETLKAYFSPSVLPTSAEDSLDNSSILIDDHVLKDNSNTEDEKDDTSDVKPPWVKKLFKKIAMITHPDKVKDKDSKQFSNIFKRASLAIDEKRYDELVGIAIDLGIDIDMSSPEMIEIIQSRIVSAKIEIKEIENNPAWIWCESIGLTDIRVDFISSYLSLIGYKIDLDREKIINIISDIENEV